MNIEELLEDIIENSKVATLRFPRNGIEAQKVLTIKAEIMKRFDELEKFYKHVHKVEYVAGITRPYEQRIAELEAQIAELEELRLAQKRYEKIRMMSPMQFSELWSIGITSKEHFDDLVDTCVI